MCRGKPRVHDSAATGDGGTLESRGGQEEHFRRQPRGFSSPANPVKATGRVQAEAQDQGDSAPGEDG